MTSELTYEDLIEQNSRLKAALDRGRETEAQERELQARIMEVLNFSRDIIYRRDFKTDSFEYIGTAFESVTGYSFEELKAIRLERFFDLIHPDDRDHIKEHIRAGMESREKRFTASLEYRLRRNDGRYIWLRDRYTLVKDDEGNPQVAMGISREITDKKIAEAALKESENRFATFMDHLPGSVFMKDEDSRLLYANKFMCDNFGADEWLYKHPRELPHQKFVEKLTQEDQVAFQKGTVEGIHEITDKHGITHSYRTIKFPIFREGNAPLLGGIALDMSEQVAAEKALREGELKYRTLFEESREAIFITDSHGKIIDLNQAVIDLLGYSREELLGTEMQSYHCDLSKQARFFEEIANKGYVRDFEDRLRKKDGMEIDCLFNVATRKNSDGSVQGFQGSVRDVTEQKQAREILRASEENYRTIFNSVNDAIFIHDLNTGDILDVNSKMCEMYGYSLEEARTLTIFELTDMREPFTQEEGERFREKVLSGRPQIFEWMAKHKDGTPFWVEVNLKRTVIGGRECVLAVVRDIEERKRAEQELREREAQYRSIFEAATDALIICDFETMKIVEANPRACTMYGYTYEELTRITPRELIHPDYHRIFQERLETLQRTKMPPTDFPVESVSVRKDGSLVYVEVRGTEFEYKGKKYWLSIARDISERKRGEEEKRKLEAQLRHVQKMEAIGTLAGGIAHDFNNLLMGIQGRVSLMHIKTDSHSPNQDHLKGIETMVVRGAELTKELLGFARGGKYEVRLTNVNDLVKKTSDMFARAKKELKINQTYQDNPWTIKVDRNQIEQVLLNLYVNAGHAMPGGGNITIATKNVDLEVEDAKPFNAKPGKYVRIQVVDTGMGMDEDTKQRIFEPFFTTKELGRGTGLGLSSAYGIIKNHGGYIYVESELNKGSAFSVYLPATEEKVPVVKPLPQQSITKGEETILLVDDEEMILEVGEKLLDALGYKAVLARSGKEAVEIYEKQKNRIDMVILDMIMSEMGGRETYNRLKELNPQVKVLLSSGYSLDGQAVKILELGCDGFVQKPFNMRTLSQKMREVLTKKQVPE